MDERIATFSLNTFTAIKTWELDVWTSYMVDVSLENFEKNFLVWLLTWILVHQYYILESDLKSIVRSEIPRSLRWMLAFEVKQENFDSTNCHLVSLVQQCLGCEMSYMACQNLLPSIQYLLQYSILLFWLTLATQPLMLSSGRPCSTCNLPIGSMKWWWRWQGTSRYLHPSDWSVDRFESTHSDLQSSKCFFLN